MKKRILIAGGTGLIGTALTAQARALGWEVTLLSRTPGEGRISWDPTGETMAIDSPLEFDAVINLAGTSIAGARWTEQRKNDIRSSRIQSGATLEKFIKAGMLRTSVYIGVSGVGIYGDRGDAHIDDSTPVDQESQDWMVNTARLWEESHARIAATGIRTVILRLGIVLSPKGGALKEILQTAPLGAITFFGAGKQIWPWIHIRDVTELMIYSILHTDTEGTYLTCASGPVSNKVMAEAIAQTLRPRRLVLPAPVFALRIVLGEMHRVLMDSCHAIPTRWQQQGYTFRFPEIQAAIKDLLQP